MDTNAIDPENTETPATDTDAESRPGPHDPEQGQAAPPPAGLTDVSTETLRRLADRMESDDPSAAPEFAGVIAAVLGSRLEATSVPDDVLETISDLLAAPAMGPGGTGARDSEVSPDPPTA